MKYNKTNNQVSENVMNTVCGGGYSYGFRGDLIEKKQPILIQTHHF